jgi:quinoprotein glucose dehydrogenase
MGLAVHPGFPDPPYIYAMHTYRTPDGGNANRVIRLVDEGDHARFDRVIIDGIPAAQYHNGGRIAFGPDDMLYVGTGDATEPELAQDLDSLAGKILRLTPDGGIPDDNPFPGSPVYSYGHRNVQGLAWNPKSGDLFASEHGPSGEFGLHAYDEINVIRPGGNYGWPEVVGAPGREGFVDPIVVWTDSAVPPAGMAFHDGSLFVATLESESLVRIDLVPTEDGYRVERITHWFAEDRGEGRYGRLRAAIVGPDGVLYFLTSNRDGRSDPRPGDDHIYRVESTN